MALVKNLSDRLLDLVVPAVKASAHCIFCGPECRDGLLVMWCRNQCTGEQYSMGVIGECEPGD